MAALNPVAELAQLALDPSLHRQVARIVETRIDQANEDAAARLQTLEARLQAKDAELRIKELKI